MKLTFLPQAQGSRYSPLTHSYGHRCMRRLGNARNVVHFFVCVLTFARRKPIQWECRIRSQHERDGIEELNRKFLLAVGDVSFSKTCDDLCFVTCFLILDYFTLLIN